ncbi:MAG: hypothetical protein M3Q11_01530 [Pseudomonadota bacterium]|jgi:hypothetical protein|nr:hypothetical protein [Pseudomonadota bacterium]
MHGFGSARGLAPANPDTHLSLVKAASMLAHYDLADARLADALQRFAFPG